MPTVAHTPTARRAVTVPRRTSGPVRRAAPTFAQRATAVADARLLDRLIRGRAWIAVIGVMLMGLVFVQVSMLRMNTGIGRDVATAAQLERSNQALRNTVATLASGDRIEAGAARLGMVMPAAGQVHYLRAGEATARTAAGAVIAPKPVVQQPAPVTTTVTPAATATTAGATTASATPTATTVTPATTATPATTTATPAATQTAASVTTTATPPQQQQATAATVPTGGAAPTP